MRFLFRRKLCWLVSITTLAAAVATGTENDLTATFERGLREAAEQTARHRQALQRWEARAANQSAIAHQRMPNTLYASTPTSIVAAGELSCPAPHAALGDSLLSTFGLPSVDEPRGIDGSSHAPRSDAPGLSRLRGVDVEPPSPTLTDLDTFTRIRAEAAVADDGSQAVYLFPRASHPSRQGFVRLINHGSTGGDISIVPTDDSGRVFDTITLAIDANETVHFNSDDLENGNTDKGLTGATGAGTGDWRLAMTSSLDIEVLAYIRTTDGFLTAMNDIAPVTDSIHRVAIFNPGSNPNQVSWLRLVNPGTNSAAITIRGTDDNGDSGTGVASLSLDAGTATVISSAQLENGANGISGSIGDGAGKWRLEVESAEPLVVMSLLESPTDHLTNLSTIAPSQTDEVHAVGLFPSASDSSGRQGFLRLVNRSATAGSVTVNAFDESSRTYDPITVAIGANQVVHFNSDDLELGNSSKGLSGGVGAGEGDWRLELTSTLEVEVLSYIRTSDGFLTAMHDVAPTAENTHRIAILNPGSNREQESLLRLINPGDATAQVTISGIDGNVMQVRVISTSRSLPARHERSDRGISKRVPPTSRVRSATALQSGNST